MEEEKVVPRDLGQGGAENHCYPGAMLLGQLGKWQSLDAEGFE